MTVPPRLSLIGISKSFGGIQAVQEVAFDVAPATIHALVGENGAGKSTLVKCIMGFYAADRGQVLLNNAEVRIHNPRDARAHGIGMVYQHFTLVPSMTVAENLLLARADLPMVIDRGAEGRRMQEFVHRGQLAVEIGFAGAFQMVRIQRAEKLTLTPFSL